MAGRSYTPAEVRALKKSQKINGHERVQRLALGKYAVESATQEGMVYLVTGSGPFPWNYACSCTAGLYGRPCWHTYAVHTRRLQENAIRELRRLQKNRGLIPSVAA